MDTLALAMQKCRQLTLSYRKPGARSPERAPAQGRSCRFSNQGYRITLTVSN